MLRSSASASFRRLNQATRLTLLLLAGGPLRATPDDSLATRRPISFTSGGNRRLHGELVEPRDTAGKPRPAVVFRVGSGNSSHRTNYRGFLREQLRQCGGRAAPCGA